MSKNIEEYIKDFYNLYHKVEKANVDKGIRCLTANEVHIICLVGEKDITVNDLADQLDITIGSLSKALSKLEMKKFIFREKLENDKRKVRVNLTTKGELAFKYYTKSDKNVLTNILEDVDKKKLKVFSEVLQKLITNLYFLKKDIEPTMLSQCKLNNKLIIYDIKATDELLNSFITQKFTIGREIKLIEKNENTLTILIDKKKKVLTKEEGQYIFCIKKEKR